MGTANSTPGIGSSAPSAAASPAVSTTASPHGSSNTDKCPSYPPDLEALALLAPVQSQLHRMAKMTPKNMPPSHPSLKCRSYMDVLKTMLLPIGEFVVARTRNRQDGPAMEMRLCKAIAKHYWPIPSSTNPALDVHTMYRNSMFKQACRLAQESATEQRVETPAGSLYPLLDSQEKMNGGPKAAGHVTSQNRSDTSIDGTPVSKCESPKPERLGGSKQEWRGAPSPPPLSRCPNESAFDSMEARYGADNDWMEGEDKLMPLTRTSETGRRRLRTSRHRKLPSEKNNMPRKTAGFEAAEEEKPGSPTTSSKAADPPSRPSSPKRTFLAQEDTANEHVDNQVVTVHDTNAEAATASTTPPADIDASSESSSPKRRRLSNKSERATGTPHDASSPKRKRSTDEVPVNEYANDLADTVHATDGVSPKSPPAEDDTRSESSSTKRRRLSND